MKEKKPLDIFDENHPKYILDWNDVRYPFGYAYAKANGCLNAKCYRVLYKDSKKKGGYISGYDVLSQEGKCRVLDRAIVYGTKVTGNARIIGKALVIRGNISDDSFVSGNTYVFHSSLSGNASTTELAELRNSQISGNAVVSGTARVIESEIMDNTRITGQAGVHGCKISKDVVFDSPSRKWIFNKIITNEDELKTAIDSENRVYHVPHECVF